MCEPTSLAIAAAVTATAATAASVVAQTKAAKAQTKATLEQMRVRNEEIDQSTSAEMNDRMRAMRREQARIRVAAGEAGLSTESGSIESLLLDSYQQAELSNDRSLANRESARRSTTAETSSALSYIQKPTALGAGLQIGATALQGASNVSGSMQRAKIIKQGGPA